MIAVTSLLVAGYLLLVATLRFRRATATIDKYIKRHDGYDLSRMTNDEAHAIMKDLVELEFPTFMGLSIVFALFKTYGIPSISRVLLTTRQLVESDTASKRTADTGVLMLEFALNPPTSERAIKAIARMNYLHSAYLKAGKISNDDMLFTLSLFALEPVRWIERYEWRGLGVLEKCALGTYWKAMGDAMAISFQGLPSCKAGWTDGRHWLREVEEWSERYARVNMMPDGSNHKLADSHLDLLFLNVPKCMKIAGKQLVGVLVGERLRKAMMLPAAPRWYHVLVNTSLKIRACLIRHFFLPRAEFRRKQYIPRTADRVRGRYNAVEYLSHPWYVKPGFVRRWGPRAWVARLLGRCLPGDDGDRYAPEGYTFEELGPQNMKGKGMTEMARTEKALKESGRGKCPFHP